jgi:WD40 repeat protein
MFFDRNIVSASNDGTIRVWDIASGFDVCFSRPGQPIVCMAKTDDNALFAAGLILPAANL